jgi:hypothetical protein
MKLPIPFLLYTAALGLAGFTGWTVYKMLPLLDEDTRKAATGKGMKDATDRISIGRGQLAISADWQYGPRTSEWWAEFKAVNFLGKLPPPPPPPPGASAGNTTTVAARDVRPLEQIIELVSLVYDSKDEGKGELSHVIVRYRTEANVQPPEWYVRETSVSTPVGGPAAPRDVAPPVRRGGNPGGPQGRQNTPNQPAPAGKGPASTMPTSQVGREVLQKVWIQGDGDPRRDAKLWPPFSDIQLVRVDPSAQIAYFTRTEPSTNPGQPVQTSKEEPLHKTSMGLSQDILQELHRLRGTQPTAAGSVGPTAVAPTAGTNTWQDVEENTLINNVRHIGRQQEQRLRENPDELWEKIHVDTYVSKQGKTRGLLVRSVDAKVASQFGVEQGDVLLEVNGRAVQTQAQALQFGKGEYKKGVRTFVTKWLSAGQVVERTYQAPDK